MRPGATPVCCTQASTSLGFLDFQDSAQSFLDLFAVLREQRVIPPLT